MSDEIRLRKVNEPQFNSLPYGVKLIIVEGKYIFVKRALGRFIQLPQEEQERLRSKHISNG